MLKKLQTLLSAFLFSVVLHAQQKISGVVYYNHAPLSGAIVKLYLKKDTAKNLIDFFITRSDGYYEFNLLDTSSLDLINVNCTGFASVDFEVNDLKKTRSNKIDFHLRREKSFLDTVKINTVFKFRVSKDTIVFNPKAYALKNERTIEEALSRLPGISIDDKGIINFNGTVISKVLIEGDDLFQKNYQELTKNAPPEMVESVEIIKNYQKDKILKEQNITDGQVINLTLNKDYKKSLLGYLNGGYGIENQKKAEVFAIHLQEKLKAESRVGYNNLGLSSAFADNNSAAQILDNNQRFPSLKTLKPFIETDRYFTPLIPPFYQQQNKTGEIINNTIFKLKRGYEMRLNIRATSDKIYQQLIKSVDYFNGITIKSTNNLEEEIRTQKLLLEGSRLLEKKSFYFNAGLERSPQTDYLNTIQIFALRQFLRTNNNLFYWNVNYNIQQSNRLWMHSLGMTFQKVNQNYFVDSNFLYWMPSSAFTRYSLNPNINKTVSKQYWKTQLNVANEKMRHEFTSMITSDYQKLSSDLKSVPAISDTIISSFRNNLPVFSLNASMKYSFHYFLTPKLSFRLAAIQQMKVLNFMNKQQNSLFYLPEYSADFKYQSSKSGEVGLAVRYQKQIHAVEDFFDNALFSNYNVIRYGYPIPYSYRNSSLTLSHAYLSLTNKGHWFSFFNGRLSFYRDQYVPSSFVANLSTIERFRFFPNNTTEIFLLNTLQRIMLKPSLQISSTWLFRSRSQYYFNNELLYLSNLMSRNLSLNVKTNFQSVLNGEVAFSFSQNENKLQLPKAVKTKFYSISQKLILYTVFSKSFFLSFSVNHLSVSNAKADNFVDLTITKKILKEKLLLELNGRNLFNEKRFEIYSINPVFSTYNNISLRGREIFFLVKYNFK